MTEIANQTELSDAQLRSYLVGSTAPTPQSLAAISAALGVATVGLAPLTTAPTLHEYRWHAGHSVASLSVVLNMSPRHVANMLRGLAPIAATQEWADALAVTSAQVEQAHRHSQLLHVRHDSSPQQEVRPTSDPWRSAVAGVSQALHTHLTARQQEVLWLMCSDLTMPQMAKRLGVGLNTIRSHVQDVYNRLGPEVVSRITARAAVAAQMAPAHVTSTRAAQLLTVRELEIFRQMNQGHALPAIAATLGLQEATIRWHLKIAYAQLQVATLYQALHAVYGGPRV